MLYDIAFGSNSPDLMKEFKYKISATFDVKFYGELKSFMRWTITWSPSTLYVAQRSYDEKFLHHFGMIAWNSVLTELPKRFTLAPDRHMSNLTAQPLNTLIGQL